MFEVAHTSFRPILCVEMSLCHYGLKQWLIDIKWAYMELSEDRSPLFQVYPEGNEDKRKGKTAQTGSWTTRIGHNDVNTKSRSRAIFIMQKEQCSAKLYETYAFSLELALFLGSRTAWMLGRTPPWAMVTPARSLLSSSSFL